MTVTDHAQHIAIVEAVSLVQLADDTIAELEAMKSENIHLSSEAVKYDGEVQAAKQALEQLTTALEVMKL